jgi:general secretion pathway protein D
MKLRDALDAVARATNTFYRVTAQSTIIVVPNTPVKQREYQEEWTQTFPIENADVAETIDLLKTALDVRFVSKMSATNLISVRDTPERLQAVGRLLQAMDKARPEVVVDVEILEVDRTKLQQYGLQVASPGSPGIAGTADPNSSTLTLHSLLNLTQSDVLMTGVPALYYNLLKTDTNTRILANPHMRASDGIAAEEKFGQRVPVPNATFAPIAAGGVNQQPITSYTYENVGVTIDITPRTHANDDVTLALKVVLSEQGAAGFGGLPTFGNREITTTIRLKDGETSILAGLVREDDTKQLDGLPGISDLPLIGRLFGNNSHTRAQTDVILTLTPHIVRVLDLSDSDLQPFRIQRDGSGGGGATIEGAPAPEVLPASPVPGTSGTGRGRGGRAPEIRSPKLELRSQK